MRLGILFILFPILALGQKARTPADDEAAPIDRRPAMMLRVSANLPRDTSAIKDFLIGQLDNRKNERSDIILEDHVSSPKAEHYRFAQTLNGRRVFRGSVKVNITDDGRVLSLFDNTFAVTSDADTEFPDHDACRKTLMAHYSRTGSGRLHDYKLQEVYFPQGDELIPAIRLEVVENTVRYYEIVLNREMRVIYRNDLLSYSAPQDSTVTLWVFNPDPLTSAEQTYGAPYTDNSDQDVLELNAERVAVQMPVTFENDTFFLRSDFASINEHSLPNTDATFSLAPEFNFTRSETGFEDACAYYHINYFQQYIRTLGFNNLVNYPISIDAHALNGSDNSNFNPGFTPPRLSFGEGGVDDAEDADVIIHEYGHAITNSAAPNTATGIERKTLDEAIGDYFASSYSRFLSSFGWSDVFSWDGHNEFWNGRSSVSSDHYPEDLNNNIYTDADIWSATLMQIWEDIGREATDAIMLQTAYSLSNNMSMADAAWIFLQADTLLFNGDNFIPIRQRMFDRGLIHWNVGIDEHSAQNLGLHLFNSAGFADGSGMLRVVSERPFTLRLYNAFGQLLLTEDAMDGALELSGENLTPGLYVVKMEAEGFMNAFKLVKH